ncbi:MAG TPA: LysR family transcriptional regulator [Solirubrobacteraceae bacterium]|nr:LysR family transcriptional regulator [Solirubrobacteraceae bacterium]
MELRQLRSFVAVAEELHFRRAADRLHLAQPSVSQQIRTLEAELGVTLFERNRRGASLTPAGAALLTEARELLGRAERAAAIVRATGTGERGRLRMSLTRSLTGGIAGAIVAAYRQRYPGVDLQLGLGNTMLNVEQLLAGEIDVGFVRPPLEEPALEELLLGREPMVCVLPAGHRLTKRTTVRPRDIEGEPLVWWPEEHGPGAWREVRREVCGDPPWPPLARTEPEEERIVSAVAEGAGISFIMLERSRSLRIPGAVYRRFASPEPTMGIALAWRRGEDLPTLHRLRELALGIVG